MEEILQPIYRIEDYWYAIANGLSCPHTPIYRIETYLAYLCGADVSVPQPIYRIEQYLAYKCGLDVELPTPIYRQEMFLAKWCGMDVEPPTPIYRIEVLLSQLSAGELKTVTGNPISISDALAKPAESLSIEILTQQDLHGYDHPWVGGMGTNMFDASAVPDENKYVNKNDGTLTAPSADTVIWKCTDFIPVVADTELYFGEANNTASTAGTAFYDSSYAYISGVSANALKNANNILTVPTGAVYMRHSFLVRTDTTEFNPDWQTTVFIVKNSDPHVWTPYANLCPISGWSNVNVYREAQYDAGATPYATINLNGTVYGGSLNVATGVLTVEKVFKEFDGSEGIGTSASGTARYFYHNINNETTQTVVNSDIISTHLPQAVITSSTTIAGCNLVFSSVAQHNRITFRLPYDMGITTSEQCKTWLSTQYNNGTPFCVCYGLFTPQTIQLTPTQIEMLLGNNVLWNDVDGDMTLEYLADGPADDIDALQILLGNRYVNNGAEDEATDREALEILLGGNTR